MVLRCGYLVLPSFTSFVLDGYLLTFPIRVGIDFTEFWGFFLRFLATFSLMRSSFFFVPCSPRFHRVFLKLRVPKPFERKVTGFFYRVFFFFFWSLAVPSRMSLPIDRTRRRRRRRRRRLRRSPDLVFILVFWFFFLIFYMGHHIFLKQLNWEWWEGESVKLGKKQTKKLGKPEQRTKKSIQSHPMNVRASICCQNSVKTR